MSNLTLYELSAQMAEIESILEDNGGELTPELEQAWVETKESLVKKADNYNALIQKFKATETAIDNEVKRLQSLLKTVKNGQKRLKEHILNCMNAFEFKHLEGEFCKFSVRNTKSLKTEEEIILSPYRSKIDELNMALPDYITVEVKVSKSLIKEHFKGTDVLPAGCEYENNQSLQIK